LVRLQRKKFAKFGTLRLAVHQGCTGSGGAWESGLERVFTGETQVATELVFNRGGERFGTVTSAGFKRVKVMAGGVRRVDRGFCGLAGGQFDKTSKSVKFL
jgi:hypothetical protein